MTGNKYQSIINLTFYLFFFSSSTFQKQLRSSLCAYFSNVEDEKTSRKTVKLIMPWHLNNQEKMVK